MSITTTRFLNPRDYFNTMVKIDSQFQEAFESYMTTKELNEKTINKYRYFYNSFVNEYGDLNQKNIGEFLQKNQSSPAKAMIKNLISSIFSWDTINEDVKRSVSIINIPIVTGKKSKVIPKFMTKSDLDRLVYSIHSGNELKDERIRLMILCQFYGGLRISELLGITHKNLILKENNIDKKERELQDKYQAIKISYKSAKFGKERFAYIPTDIFKRMVIFNKNNIIDYSKSKKPYNPEKSMWDIKANRYKALLDKYTTEVLGEHYNSHSLRHGRGTNLINDEKKSIEFVKKYLGHADIRSTQIYVHLNDKQIKEELEK